jgi:hypothetical protein
MKCHACKQELYVLGADDLERTHWECLTPECTQFRVELY